MAFRKKAGMMLALQPDILIVQECEHPDKLSFPAEIANPEEVIWIGTNDNKGLAILSYNGFKIELHKKYDPEIRLVAPIKVSKDNTTFMLFAIWANNPGDPDGQYIGQVWKALHHYDRLIKKHSTILIGDFNSNSIWDKPRRPFNHTTIVERLQLKGIDSLYHHHFNQVQGKELHPTLYLYKHQNRPYHIDYCFASRDFTEKLEGVEIGDHAGWMKYSDHVPIMVSFSKL